VGRYGEIAKLIIVDIAAIYAEDDSLYLAWVLRHVRPHIGGKIAVVVWVENEVGVWVAYAVCVVYYEIIGVIYIVGQTAHSSPEISLTLIGRGIS